MFYSLPSAAWGVAMHSHAKLGNDLGVRRRCVPPSPPWRLSMLVRVAGGEGRGEEAPAYGRHAEAQLKTPLAKWQYQSHECRWLCFVLCALCIVLCFEMAESMTKPRATYRLRINDKEPETEHHSQTVHNDKFDSIHRRNRPTPSKTDRFARIFSTLQLDIAKFQTPKLKDLRQEMSMPSQTQKTNHFLSHPSSAWVRPGKGELDSARGGGGSATDETLIEHSPACGRNRMSEESNTSVQSCG